MLKLPSPSVVCAQNSPVILTMGFTRVRSIGNGGEAVAHLAQGGHEVVAEELVEELAEIFRGAGEARLLQERRAVLPSSSPGLAAAHHLVQDLHGFFEDAVGLAGVHLVGANLVGDVVDDVADVQRVQDGQEEVDVHLQAGFGFGLVQAAALLEEQHAELVEARSCAARGGTRIRTCRSGRGRRRRR